MKRKIILGIAIFVCLIIVDRFTWMPERTKKVWVNESGRNLGDPIAFDQDFLIDGNRIVFKNNKSKNEYPAVINNRKSEFYSVGCYFGNFYILDLKRDELIKYSSY